MSKNLQSPTKLTEFAPLQPEEKQQGVSQFISKFFKLTRSNNTTENTSNKENNADKLLQESLPAWAIDNSSENENSLKDGEFAVDIGEGRSLPNVLKRISSLLALNKSSNSQSYSDSDLKQYWMPDSVSKECYECCEKFTTFRRRHHCRVCGQIFCAQCCNIQIPGKIFRSSGYLRACTYCCRIVIGYLESLDLAPDLTACLKQLQDSVENKSNIQGDFTTNLLQNRLSPISSSTDSLEVGGTLRRKVSVGYQEEKFAPGSSCGNYITIEERCKALQNSVSLRNLYEEICRPTTGIILRKQKYRLRTYSDSFLGSELVDWLIRQQKANTRIQACTFCQALLEGGYIEAISDPSTFVDGFSLYKLGVVLSPDPPPSTTEPVSQDEPSWVKFIPQESNTTDSESDPMTPPFGRQPNRMTSSSSYTLDLNINANTVYLSKPIPSSHSIASSDDGDSVDQKGSNSEISVVRTTEQHEIAPESGWHNPTQLREENNEKLAYNLLQDGYNKHEASLVNQLLNQHGLQLTWAETLVPLIHEIVDVVRPDLNHNAEIIDIRHYVKFKKLSGGTRQDCKLVRGIVCSKNIAHKAMASKFENPKILLLEGAVVYQRIEGRLMSLEPVLMQEHESLRNLAAKIIALKPDIVLVQRNVARLAQDILREQGVTLVINVNQKILEGLARCMQADLIASLDAHLIGKPRLGTCKSFYLKIFKNSAGESKTLMFFEGLPQNHLCGTILLRGAAENELIRVKKVALLLLFACYNWRLEKSFFMDMFALPPNFKNDIFDDSRENSPTAAKAPKNIIDDPLKLRKTSKTSQNIFDDNENDTDVFNNKVEAAVSKQPEPANNNSEERKISSEVVQDFSDPLHLYSNDDVELRVTAEKLSVAELPFSNQFRKSLDDTILCVSPFLRFTVPYLETENGRKCKLRNFFPDEIFCSKQFSSTKRKTIRSIEDDTKQIKLEKKIKPPHPFVTMKLGINVNSNEVQNLLAHYRACGGRYEKRSKFSEQTLEESAENEKDNEQEPLDALDPYNHQKLDALYYSFSHKSANAPAFCVNPWVVHMTFYKDNDIPLGCFLEKYCFRMSYGCQSKTCGIAMMNHIRRFVHNSGCISISLDVLDNKISEDKIIMWSWCTKCQTCSPSVPMSSDTWSFSLAKYLEIRFHGGLYTRRGNIPCPHSLHQDNLQYFSYNNIVATFEYTHIQMWEISLPPPTITIQYNKNKQRNDMIEEIKMMSLKGHEIFSLVMEKLAALPSDFDGLSGLKQMQASEQSVFKQKVEEVQLHLTSPSLENIYNDFSNPNLEIQVAIWRISDKLVKIKKLIVEALERWNLMLSESIKKRDIDKKRDRNLHTDLESPGTPDSRGSIATSEPEIKDTTSGTITKKIRSLDQGDGLETVAKEDNVEHWVTESPALLNSFSNASFSSSKSEESIYNRPFRAFRQLSRDSVDTKYRSRSSSKFKDTFQIEDNAPPSPKAHHRSQSDGTILSQYEDGHDGKKEDKKSVKHIFSQLLPSTTPFIPILNPFNSSEHYMLPIGVYVPIVVYENEPSSIIAYALNSFDYKRSLEEILYRRPQSTEQSPSPIHKRYSQNDKEKLENADANEKSSGLLSFLRTKDSKTDLLNSVNSTSDLSQTVEIQPGEKAEDPKKGKSPHIEVQFEDSNCNFFCRIYFAEKFAHLRSFMLPIGEEAYIRSLSRSIQWNARGGKSGSTFCKTTDDRFILKEMPKSEIQLFLEFAPNYFQYMNHCHETAQPTLLGKIIGIYQIIFKNNTTNATLRTHLLVMENLFYNRTVTQKFDLKGSMRNRLVNPDNQDGEIVLLDENLLKMSCDSPLYILPHSKAVLTAAIQKDIEFLSAQSVMDYSLLVGLDPENKELVVGIIDYIRTFTWDKRLETMVKKSGMLWGQGKLPTIVSPEEYRDRFIEAMHKYFLEVPDQWTSLGKNLEY